MDRCSFAAVMLAVSVSTGAREARWQEAEGNGCLVEGGEPAAWGKPIAKCGFQ